MKICAVCDEEFYTPGVRCKQCRDKAVPTLKTINSRGIHFGVDPAKEGGDQTIYSPAISAVVFSKDC